MTRIALALAVFLGSGAFAFAQATLPLDPSCTVTVGNQTAFVRVDGMFFVPNISIFQSRDTGAAPQLYKVRATCLRNGQMETGQSAFFPLTPGQTTFAADVLPGALSPIPARISATSTAEFLPQGATAQITVTATLPDGQVVDVTSRTAGTTYLSTNPGLLNVDQDGLVTGANASTFIQTGTIAILHEGNLATLDFTAVGPSNDFDNDGMPNDYEDLFGLNKFANDANGDLDGDGLTNLTEFQRGTLPNNPDTDMDGIPDGVDGDPLHPEEAAPTVLIVSPGPGTVLLHGQTLAVTAQAMDDGLLTGLRVLVNGAPFGTSSTSPLSLTFTVPYAATVLNFTVEATDSVGHVGTATASVAVSPDPLTTVRGNVVGPEGSPVPGAAITLHLDGLKGELFDFDTPLSTLPDLAGLTPDATRLVSALNFRNPDGLLSGDTFGLGFSPDFAARFTGLLRVPVSGPYTFTLGADDGARLTVAGTPVTEVPGTGGAFAEATGSVNLTAGTVPLQVDYFQATADSEIQLSVLGPAGGDVAVIRPSDLVQSPVPFGAVTDPAGAFSIAGVPTILGPIRAQATATVDGKELQGSFPPAASVRGGITNLGTLQLASGEFDLRFVAGLSQADLESALDAAAPPSLPPLASFTDAVDGAVFTGDFLQIGVNAQGSLIYSFRGLAFAPAGNGAFGPDVLAIGTERDVWGGLFQAAGQEVSGFGGSNFSANDGDAEVVSFKTFTGGGLSAARSVTRVGPLEVTTVTALRHSDRVVFIDVSLTNTGAVPLTDVLFSRSADLDLNGGFFNAFDVTASPGGLTVISAGNPGAQFAGLATARSFWVADGFTFASSDPSVFENGDPDGLINDLSASFVFSFPEIPPGASVKLGESVPNGGGGSALGDASRKARLARPRVSPQTLP